jgi:hypothetical protein
MRSIKHFPWKKPLKNDFLKETLPYTLSGSANAPYPSLGERCNTQDTILGERWVFLKEFWAALPCPLSGSVSALYPCLGECCNARCTLLGEHWHV